MTLPRDVNLPEEYSSLLKLLVPKPFKTHKSLACFCAFLGFSLHERKTLTKKYENAIKAVTFDSNNDDDFVMLIGVAEKKDISILSPSFKTPELENREDDDKTSKSEEKKDNDYVKIFEEYAYGGMSIVANWLAKYGGDPSKGEAIIQGMRDQGFIPKDNNQVSIDISKIDF